jgi:hypothetical protein
VNLNPLGITGPNSPPPYQQPGTGNPEPPANQPEIGATGRESFNQLTYPIPQTEGGNPAQYDGSCTGTYGYFSPTVRPSMG